LKKKLQTKRTQKEVVEQEGVGACRVGGGEVRETGGSEKGSAHIVDNGGGGAQTAQGGGVEEKLNLSITSLGLVRHDYPGEVEGEVEGFEEDGEEGGNTNKR